jgi:DNA-binding transcriptional MerR regulator
VAKGPEAFRTISEAATELGVPQHVLRFWESKFSFIRPMKRAGGRRFYRPQDIAVLAGVQRLLHQEGYTIKGVQRLHKEEGMARILSSTPLGGHTDGAGSSPSSGGSPRPAVQGALAAALADLESAKRRLDGLLE